MLKYLKVKLQELLPIIEVIIEENELKRRIAEKIRDIRGEAELKKLNMINKNIVIV